MQTEMVALEKFHEYKEFIIAFVENSLSDDAVLQTDDAAIQTLLELTSFVYSEPKVDAITKTMKQLKQTRELRQSYVSYEELGANAEERIVADGTREVITNVIAMKNSFLIVFDIPQGSHELPEGTGVHYKAAFEEAKTQIQKASDLTEARSRNALIDAMKSCESWSGGGMASAVWHAGMDEQAPIGAATEQARASLMNRAPAAYESAEK